MMKIQPNEEIKLKLPKFEVDDILSPHLEEIPLLSNINKSFACSFIGMAGSGKTSLMIGLLQTKHIFKKVFHKIYVFMPDYSRGSMQKCIFDCLPDDQIYNELNIDTLTDVYKKCKENSEENLLSLVIFDDVQDAFKGECEKLMLKIINNRRHLRTSIMLLAQSYLKISRDVRKVLTHHFLFNLSKQEFETIRNERFYIKPKVWEDIIEMFIGNSHQKGKFLFIYPDKKKIFLNWDEIILE